MKLRTALVSMVLALVLFVPTTVKANYVRPNNFMDKSGSEKVAEIKRFQALNNIPVSGKLDALTNKVLYGPNMMAHDEISNLPTSGDWIVINKSKKILTYYRGNAPMYKLPVALGTPSTPTPSGIGKIANKHVNPAWGGMFGKYEAVAADDPNNPLGERWMGLSIPGANGYGIHGTIKPLQIGTYASNGCIRMYNYDIETFIFPLAKVGMPVYLGTDQELASWGIRQLLEEKSQNAPKAQVTQPVQKDYKAEELLVF